MRYFILDQYSGNIQLDKGNRWHSYFDERRQNWRSWLSGAKLPIERKYISDSHLILKGIPLYDL